MLHSRFSSYWHLLSGLLLLTLFWAGCEDDHVLSPSSPFLESYVETSERSLEGTDITRLEVSTKNGSLTAIGVRRSGFEFSIEKKVQAPTRDQAIQFAARVRIVIRKVNDEIRAFPEYPTPPRNVTVTVNLVVRCPQNVGVCSFALNGSITVSGIAGTIEASTGNGNIRAEVDDLQSRGTYTAVNGGVNLKVRAGTAPLSIKTVNGPIVVALHPGFSGTLDAVCVNGRIESPCPSNSRGANEYRTTCPLGEGGPTPVLLRAVNGPIELSVQDDSSL